MTAIPKVSAVHTTSGVAVEIWERRSVILTAFGLVGFGALVGAGSVYFFYIKRKIEEHFQIQSTVTSQLNQLKTEVEQLKSTVTISDERNHSIDTVVTKKKNLSSGKRSAANGRRVRFNDGYETADDEVYVSASSGSEYENDDETVKSSKTNFIDKYKNLIEQVNEVETGENVEDPQTNFLTIVDNLLEGNPTEQHEAFLLLTSNQNKLNQSFEFWWRFAKATSYEANQAGNSGDTESKKNLSYAAFSYAEKSLTLNDMSANSHKWYAITLGSKGEFLAIKEKIKNGFTFKEHVDRAVQLDPKDSALHHLLGRFCFEVSQLSWIERKVASTLFSTPPSATVAEALSHFLKAENMGKPFKENRLFIAKCYLQMKDSAKAAEWLDSAARMPIISAADKTAHEQITKLKK